MIEQQNTFLGEDAVENRLKGMQWATDIVKYAEQLKKDGAAEQMEKMLGRSISSLEGSARQSQSNLHEPLLLTKLKLLRAALYAPDKLEACFNPKGGEYVLREITKEDLNEVPDLAVHLMENEKVHPADDSALHLRVAKRGKDGSVDTTYQRHAWGACYEWREGEEVLRTLPHLAVYTAFSARQPKNDDPVSYLPSSIRDVIRGTGNEAGPGHTFPNCMTFYSISNMAPKWARGLGSGGKLISQVHDYVTNEHSPGHIATLETFVTLSPIRDFQEWVSLQAYCGSDNALSEDDKQSIMRIGDTGLDGKKLLEKEVGREKAIEKDGSTKETTHPMARFAALLMDENNIRLNQQDLDTFNEIYRRLMSYYLCYAAKPGRKEDSITLFDDVQYFHSETNKAPLMRFTVQRTVAGESLRTDGELPTRDLVTGNYGYYHEGMPVPKAESGRNLSNTIRDQGDRHRDSLETPERVIATSDALTGERIDLTPHRLKTSNAQLAAQ